MAIPLESGEGDMRFDRAGRGSRTNVAHTSRIVAHTSRIRRGWSAGGAEALKHSLIAVICNVISERCPGAADGASAPAASPLIRQFAGCLLGEGSSEGVSYERGGIKQTNSKETNSKGL